MISAKILKLSYTYYKAMTSPTPHSLIQGVSRSVTNLKVNGL